jgi:hypothetical protein
LSGAPAVKIVRDLRHNRTEIKALESELSRRENPPMKRRRV